MTKRKETMSEKRSRWDRGDQMLGSRGSSGSYAPTVRCYESHPVYEIAPGVMIYGGSCIHPIVKDADIYGGFDVGMKMSHPKFPWSKEAGGPIEFLFKISDMQAPTDIGEFSKMIGWLSAQLKQGKKVHLGCIGGHGRTGMVLAALRKHLTDDVDAAQHVRENYCKKAVESKTQVDWLQKHYGINPVEPTKSYGYSTDTGRSKSNAPKASNTPKTSRDFAFEEYPDPLLDFGMPKDTTRFHNDDPGRSQKKSTGLPLYSQSSMWG